MESRLIIIIKNGLELSNLVVLEVLLTEQYDIEFYFEYHEAIYNFFQLKPDDVKGEALEWIESFVDSDPELVLFKKLVNFVSEIIMQTSPEWNDVDYDKELFLSQIENG